MSPIALILNVLLGGLLIAALALGVRLDRRLRALRDSQAGFIKAVNDLDQAAARTHAGLAQWRDATDEARELLHDRIEKAKVQSSLLEKLIRDSASIPEPTRLSEPARGLTRAQARQSGPSLARRPAPEPAAEPVLDLTARDARPIRGEPAPRFTSAAPRSRVAIDDDLFEAMPTGAAALQRDLALALERRFVNRLPRFLPVLVVVVGGVLAARAASGAADLPSLLAGAKAWAEEAAPAIAAADAKTDAAKEKAQSPLPPGTSIMPPAKVAPQACAPTAAELARQAGLSPAELQVLQSLGVRRGQLEDREKDMDVQLALVAAAEAKLDAKIRTMNGLKTDIQGLVGQAEAQKQAEQDRLVRVYETMKPKDAAARVTILDDSVRLPIAAKMKDRALSAILAQMPPQEAKALTEKLSNRLAAAEAARQSIANPPPAPVAPPAKAPSPAPAKPPVASAAAPAPTAQASADSPKPAAAKPRPKPRPKAQAKAPAKPAVKPEAKPGATATAPSAAPPAGPPPAPAAAAAPAAKSG